MKHAIIGIAAAISLTGCLTNVQDYDPNSFVLKESEQWKDTPKTQPIGFELTMALKKGIAVDVVRAEDFYDSQLNVKRQTWDVYIKNSNNENKCVQVVWQLKDFDLVSEYPANPLVKGKSMMYYGSMVGNIWNIDGVPIAPDPSGYVYKLTVMDPFKEITQKPYSIKETCTQFVREEDIISM